MRSQEAGKESAGSWPQSMLQDLHFLTEIKILALGLEETFIGWMSCLEFQER